MKNKINWINILIFILAIIGFITSVKLTGVYFDANFSEVPHTSFCVINETLDCDAVAKTQYSLFMGVPLSIWGSLFYVFVVFMLFWNRIKTFLPFKDLKNLSNTMSYISFASLVAVASSIYLAYISSHVIHKICILCYFTYFLNICILLLSSTKQGIIQNTKTSFKDLSNILSKPVYLVSSVILAVIFIVTVLFVEKSKVFIPENISNAMDTYVYDIKKPIGNVLGDINAKVIINEYTDFQCPFCAISNSTLLKIARDFDNVLIIHHDYPLDSECNKIITNKGHQGSCLYSRYARAAQKQNKFWDLSSIMFANHKTLSEKIILENAEKLGLDTLKLKQDAYSQEIKAKLKKDVELTNKNNIKATPTYIIGVKTYEGLLNYQQLENILLESGARKKDAE